jgi:parallel beta-helix repeat protein
MFLCVGTVVLLSRPAQAAIVVGSCMGTAKYTTIQDAVNAAPSGSVIKVCPGGYPEQVVIDKPLTLEGFITAGTEGAFILPPAGGIVQNDNPYSAQVLVQNTTGVTITNLIVDGTNSAPCGINYLTGIDFHNASGTVNKVAVHNQAAAIACGGYGVTALVDNGQAAQKITLQNSDFRNQTTIAIYGSGSGLTMNTLNNFIAGPDKGGQTVGIIYNYATGAIQGNTVTGEVYPQATFATPSLLDAMGIAVYCATATVTGNMVSNTQLGIAVGCENSNGPFASNTTISGNKIFNTRLQDGIYIFSTGNKITSNTIVASAASGIHFDTTFGGNDASGNTVSGNSITEACAGILTTGTATNTVGANSFNAVDVPTQNGGTCGPLFQ